jgi:hypothetical protein
MTNLIQTADAFAADVEKLAGLLLMLSQTQIAKYIAVLGKGGISNEESIVDAEARIAANTAVREAMAKLDALLDEVHLSSSKKEFEHMLDLCNRSRDTIRLARREMARATSMGQPLPFVSDRPQS